MAALDARELTRQIGDTLLTSSRALKGFADEIKSLRNSRNSMKVTNLVSSLLNKAIDFENLADLTEEYYNDLENAYLDDITSRDVEDWKDIVMRSLPEGASVKMADDVEAALENIKSVY